MHVGWYKYTKFILHWQMPSDYWAKYPQSYHSYMFIISTSYNMKGKNHIYKKIKMKVSQTFLFSDPRRTETELDVPDDIPPVLVGFPLDKNLCHITTIKLWAHEAYRNKKLADQVKVIQHNRRIRIIKLNINVNGTPETTIGFFTLITTNINTFWHFFIEPSSY